jgi:DNA-binding XRE family transcriptional regulator
VINGPDGKPAFVVIPYDEYRKSLIEERGLIPHEVVSATVDGATPVRAWREYLGLTQAEVAARLKISQPSYAKQENSESLRRSTKEKIAAALGITFEQLDF